jgi:hypothetical protein
MSRIGSLDIGISANTGKLENDLKRAQGALNTSAAKMAKTKHKMAQGFKSIERSVLSLRTAVIGLAGAAVIGGISKLTSAYAVQEKAVKSLNSALMATGRFSAEASAAIQKNASDIQALTTVGDEALLQATARFSQFATGLNTTEINKAQRAVVGLSEALGMDLNSAALALGKTVGTSTNALARYGIQVDKNASQSEKLNQIMLKAEAMFQQAAANTDTLEGRSIQLKNAWGDLQETLGGLILKLGGGTDGIKAMTDKIIELDNWLKVNERTILNFGNAIKSFGTNTYKVFEGILMGMSGLVTAFGAMLIGMVDDVLASFNTIARHAENIVNRMVPQFQKAQRDSMGIFGGMFGGQKEFKIKAPQIDHSGVTKFERAFSQSAKDMFGKAESAFKGIEGLNFDLPTPNIKSGGSAIAGLMGDLGASGGKAGKAAKDRVLESLKSEAEAIRKRNRTIFEIEKEGLDQLNKIRQAGLVEMETYVREKERLAQSTMDAIKVPTQDIRNATDQLLTPFKTLMGEMENGVRVSEEFNQKFAYAQQVLENLKTPAEHLEEQIAKLNQTFSEGFLDLDQYKKALSTMKTEGVEMMSTLEQAVRGFGMNFENAFMRAMDVGKFEFADFTKAILKDIARIALHIGIIRPLTNMITGGIAGAFTSSVSPAMAGGMNVGSMIGKIPGFANGGYPPIGKDFIVGEEGPEIMNLGRSSTVTPISNGSKRVIINNEFNISGGDQEDRKTFSQQIAAEIQRMAQMALDDQLRDHMRPGGLLYQGAY